MPRKGYFLILLINSILLISGGCGHNKSEKASLYAEIDEVIENQGEYEAAKQKRIDDIKQRLNTERTPEKRRELTDQLITEYEAFISDSALYYVNLNLQNPSVEADKKLETALLIRKADIAAHAGLFGESLSILESIDRGNLQPELLENYYSAYCDLYQYQSEYATAESEYGNQHASLRELYIDSISMVAPKHSMHYIEYQAAKEARNGNYDYAENLLKENIQKYLPGDRNYSILASILADIYKQKGDDENYHKYISMSVISDLKGAVKENMAIRALATECYEEGDLERADKYLRQSFADANFYSARMRNAQSSRMLPIIGEAYIGQQKSLHHKLSLFIIFISILAAAFIVIAVIAILQVKKIRAVNRRTNKMLKEVSELSTELSTVNKELSEANKELQVSNAIKGEYGALFMEYCSLAISSLQQYQQSLRVAATQGNMQTLIKKIDSANVENKTLAEFYLKFDEAILNIYPNFVEKFNLLLKPEERIVLKPKENLNTELRVFALIRIGITDSEKIAKFLRCSLSTVYTYRSKMKKKALDPDNFESRIMEI